MVDKAPDDAPSRMDFNLLEAALRKKVEVVAFLSHQIDSLRTDLLSLGAERNEFLKAYIRKPRYEVPAQPDGFRVLFPNGRRGYYPTHFEALAALYRSLGLEVPDAR